MANGRVICLGEALIDAVTRGDCVREHVGGSVLNVAAGVAALNHNTTLASAWAQDERGELLDEFTSSHDITVTADTRTATHTTVAHATVDAAGHATYTFDLDWQVPTLPDLSTYGHFHVGSFAATIEPQPVLAAVRDASAVGTVSYDPNIRPAVMGSADAVRPVVEALIGHCDVVKASDEDLDWLYPHTSVREVMRTWLAAGVGLVVVTTGAKGALVALACERDLLLVEPAEVEVEDTVGAGDSFMAGLISGLIDAGLAGSIPTKEALRCAHWAEVIPAIHRATVTSGLTVARAGAYAPDRDEVEEFIGAHSDLA